MSLSPDEIRDEHDYFNTVAEAQGMTEQEVIDTFNDVLRSLLKNESSKDATRDMILLWAKAGMNQTLANRENPSGDPYHFMFFLKVGKVGDWNEEERKTLSDMARNKKFDELKAMGALFLAPNGRPLVSIDYKNKDTIQYEPIWITKDGKVSYEDPKQEGQIAIKELKSFSGVEWDGIQTLNLFRDHRRTSKDRPNYGYSKELRPRLHMQIVGLGFPEGEGDADYRLIQFDVQGDLADEKSEHFFFRKFKPYTWYKQNFELDPKKTRPWQYSLKMTAVQMKACEEGLPLIQLDMFLEGLADAYGAEAMQDKGYIPRVIQPTQIKDFIDNMKLLDKNGNPVKSKKDPTKDANQWNAFAILQAYIKIGEKKDKSGFFYIISDAAMKKPINAFPDIDCPDVPAKLPATCLCTITGYRQNKKYDPILKKKVPLGAGEMGDISLQVHSIVTLDNIPTVTVEKL